MKKRTLLFLFISHLFVGGFGFATGIYVLPILIAPEAPTESEVTSMSSRARFTGEFRRDLRGSDAFHWGEGTVSVGQDYITLMGKLAPGPDYKLYLSPEFVESEEEFNARKSSMVQVGDVKTFDNFVVKLAPGTDPSDFNTVIVWCETFGEFISSAKYR